MANNDFYEPAPIVAYPSAIVTKHLPELFSSSVSATTTIIVTICLVGLITRLFSGSESEPVTVDGKRGRSVWLKPYWIPVIGHGYHFLANPMKLMRKARDESSHGIFALNLGGMRHNIISDPGLVKGVLQQKESAVQFYPLAWVIVEKFLGIPRAAKAIYTTHWEELMQAIGYMLKEPHLSKVMETITSGLEKDVAQMISFARSEIDQHSWERFARATYVSDSETELDLMALMRDLLGNASVSAVFGRALLDNNPELLHDVYDLDQGVFFFLMGLPAFTPWPGVLKAHAARSRVWKALNDHQRALDAMVDGEAVDPIWGDLDDVSEMIKKRHSIFKNAGFKIEERGDISILWALVVNANLVVFWLLLHILATPGLVERIREEVAPCIHISRPETIGKFSEAPKLKINHQELSRSCPLLKSSFFEALRLSSQPWSIRKVASDIITPSDRTAQNPVSYTIHNGEYVTVPHDLHMLDARYFKDPTTFDPERFMIRNEDGLSSTSIGTIRPFGAGHSICKGRILAERECLAMVAAILMFWSIEPADEKTGWVIPKQRKTTAVSLPWTDVRVRIKRRLFEWEK